MKKKKKTTKKPYNLNDHLHCFFCEIGPVSDKKIKKKFSFYILRGFEEVVCEDCEGQVTDDFKPFKEIK